MYPSSSSSSLFPTATPTHSTRALLLTTEGAYRSAANMMLLAMLIIMTFAGSLTSAQDETDASTNLLRLVQYGLKCTPGGSTDDLSAVRFNALKQNLSTRASVALYALSEDIDPVSGYGASMMYQCRGDLSLSDCALCVRAAFATDVNCSNPGFAQVELQGCGVIYSNQSIQGGYYYFLTFLVSTEARNATYFRNRDTAVASVAKQAIENKRTLGTYWAVDVVGAGEDACYALAQCHGYLPPSDCAYCLSQLANPNLLSLNESTGLTGARIYFGSCYARYERNIFYNASNTPTLLTSLGPSSSPPLAPLASPLPGISGHSSGKISNVGFVEVVVVTSSLCSMLGCLFGWFLHRIRTRETWVSNKLENKIGEGRFGALYLGTLENGDKVAIKKLIHFDVHGKEQFLNEVKLIRSLQHRNLVRFIGCSLEGEDDSRFIVYEYLSNQSLDKHLFGKASYGKGILPWNKRREILEGVARGLTYLHHDSHWPIIHRDINVANILLDDGFNPKIADFGIAKLFAFDRTHLSTNIVGTMGYIAPEYALNGQVSMKSDVFSFGLLMLEVISGRRVFEVSSPENQQYLLHWAWRLHHGGRELEMVDEAILQQDHVEEEVKRFIHVALLCCQTSPSQRPSMLHVLEMLVDLGSVLDIPTMPTYLTSKSTVSHQ